MKSDPGIYFKLPFGFLEADNVQMIEDRLLSFELDNIRVQVSGGKFYEVDAFLVYRITDPRKFRQTVSGDVTLAEARCVHVSMRRCVVSTVCVALRPPCLTSAPA